MSVQLSIRDMRPHRFLVQLNPPFRNQHFSFTGHFVANPATHFTENERGIRPKWKTHDHTTVLNKQKRTVCVFRYWLICQLASFEALLSLEKHHQRSTAIVERGSFFCFLLYKYDIRQHWVISLFSRITSGTHVPIRILVITERCNFWDKEKAATHVPIRQEVGAQGAWHKLDDVVPDVRSPRSEKKTRLSLQHAPVQMGAPLGL